MRHLLEQFETLHVRQYKIPRQSTRLLKLYFDPLRAHDRQALTPLMIRHWMNDIGTHSQSEANHCLSLLRSAFEWGKRYELFTGENPAKRVPMFRRYARTRYIKAEEMPKLVRVVNQERSDVRCYVLLCLLVGCRPMEAAAVQWSHIDVESGLWQKPTTKTGLPHTVPIPESLLELMKQLPRKAGNPYVFWTHRIGGHWSHTTAITHWHRVRQDAGIPDVRIHDLRRTCASWLAMNGENLSVIGTGVLNHTSLRNTAIYARLNTSPVKRALEANSQRILGGSLPEQPTPPAWIEPRPSVPPPPTTAPSPAENSTMEWPG